MTGSMQNVMSVASVSDSRLACGVGTRRWGAKPREKCFLLTSPFIEPVPFTTPSRYNLTFPVLLARLE